MSTFLSLALASQFSSAQLLEAIGHAETGMNYAAIGDKGESRGAWQISRTVWKKFSAHDWRTYAHRPSYSERVAAQYLEWLRGSFTWDQKRQPTCEDMLCLWQLGFHGYKQRGFDHKRAPASVRAAIKRLSASLRADYSPAQNPTTKPPSVVAGGRASISSRPAVLNQKLRVVSSRDTSAPRRRVSGPGCI